VQCCELVGREASPTTAIIDSQRVKSAEMGRAGSSVYKRLPIGMVDALDWRA
jgi:hypothetical protein